jgi:spoIIIJ-associated protein
MRTAEKSARTIEEAITACLTELGGISREKAEIEILEEPGKGLFGLFGTKPARVRVSIPALDPGADDGADNQENRESPDAESNQLSPAEIIALTKRRGDEAQVFLRRLLTAMSVEAEMEVSYHLNNIKITITGQDIGILIGRRGETLDALQLLTNFAVERRAMPRSRIFLDVAGYRKKREEILINLACRLADKVKRTNNRVTLEPMSSYERRIIHTALQNEWNLTTFSEGDEPKRHVVIAPKRGGLRPE